MQCSLSNETCLNPVISKKTGHIFEKSLIEKHLKIHKSCPITSESMTMEDTIEINSSALPSPPKAVNASSVPLLLKTFQNEWDELMLESYNLKKKLQDTRQQLSHSMYQYDAAIRVIARLTQERDRALQELANTRESMQAAVSQVESMKALHLEKNNINNRRDKEEMNEGDIDMNDQSNGGTMDVDGADDNNNTDNNVDEKQNALTTNADDNTLSQELISSITLTALELAKVRKKESKKACPDLVSMDVISSDYKVCDAMSYMAHSECDPGINCMDIDSEYPHNRIVTGGNDAQIIIYNRNTSDFEYVLKGHGGAINDVGLHPTNKNMVLSASSDASCVVWKLLTDGNKYSQVWNMNEVHSASVISLSVHPFSSEYFLTCSRDGLWCFNSLNKRKSVLRVYNDTYADNIGFSAMELHPDGQILATGSNDKKLKIWDIRTSQIGLTFPLDAEVGNITCCNFNQNGYYLACGHVNGICNVWDLRKIGKAKSSSNQFVTQMNVGQRIKALHFNQTGQYLAVGQPNGCVLYQSKKWNKFAQFKCHNKHVTSIRFAQNAKFILTASHDRYVKILTNQAQ